MSELNIAEHRLPQDGAISFISEREDIDVDIRLSILPNVRGERCVMRLLRKDSINIDEYRKFIDLNIMNWFIRT